MPPKLPESLDYAAIASTKVRKRFSRLAERYRNLRIGRKLTLSFGLLVGITFLVVGRNYWGSFYATKVLERTQDIRMSTALRSAEAETNLLQMLSSVRGYMATGKSVFRSDYQQARQNFEANLTQLEVLLERETASKSTFQLKALLQIYQEWGDLPEQMFTLRDDFLKNQPALALLDQQGELAIATISANIDSVIEVQKTRDSSEAAVLLLLELVEFKHSFDLSIAALRSYLVTQDLTFRFEYATNMQRNQQALGNIQRRRSQLTAEQQSQLDSLLTQQQQLTALSGRLFETVESQDYRRDLALLRDQTEPLAEEMLDHLDVIVEVQQAALTSDIRIGSAALRSAQWQTLLFGLTALVLGGILTVVLRRHIDAPVIRLTQVTQRVTRGDLSAHAIVESRDEIGVLATAFNQMTRSLKQSRDELEQYSHTLEGRVQSRTQELQEKNAQLEQALENLKQAQSQLIQTEKMSSLGQLVAGVAHEINNPVTFVYANLDYVSTYSTDLLRLINQYQTCYPEPAEAVMQVAADVEVDFIQDDMPRMLNSMRVGAERIREIVYSLRSFSRIDEAQTKGIDIHRGLDDTLLILQNRCKANGDRDQIEVYRHYGNLPKIECYASQLSQVFMNIISNAIDALEDAMLSPDGLSPAVLTIQTESLYSDQIAVWIVNNGPEIPEAVRPHLFDPFFTTKPIGKGTGLGLAISYQIVVEKHGGKLSYNSSAEGTQFRIQLPVQMARATA
ncbi:MAG: ATP-binding protein [Elainellaceae cyanobacterium]